MSFAMVFEVVWTIRPFSTNSNKILGRASWPSIFGEKFPSLEKWRMITDANLYVMIWLHSVLQMANDILKYVSDKDRNCKKYIAEKRANLVDNVRRSASDLGQLRSSSGSSSFY